VPVVAEQLLAVELLQEIQQGGLVVQVVTYQIHLWDQQHQVMVKQVQLLLQDILLEAVEDQQMQLQEQEVLVAVVKEVMNHLIQLLKQKMEQQTQVVAVVVLEVIYLHLIQKMHLMVQMEDLV
jgi:hypothetical protein